MQYIDLYLIHWPIGKVEEGKIVKQVPLHKTWEALEECVDNGLTKAIGLSNFNVQIILDLLSYARIKPAVNEVELHPFLTQSDLLDFCGKFGIKVIAFNPVARGVYVQANEEFENFDIFRNQTILNLAEKYKKSPTQIVSNWHLNRGVCILRRSANYDRQFENLDCFDFKLTDEEYLKISKLNCDRRFMGLKEDPFFAGINLFA